MLQIQIILVLGIAGGIGGHRRLKSSQRRRDRCKGERLDAAGDPRLRSAIAGYVAGAQGWGDARDPGLHLGLRCRVRGHYRTGRATACDRRQTYQATDPEAVLRDQRQKL